MYNSISDECSVRQYHYYHWIKTPYKLHKQLHICASSTMADLALISGVLVQSSKWQVKWKEC